MGRSEGHTSGLQSRLDHRDLHSFPTRRSSDLGIIKVSGGDYFTFDGIDLQENPANITATTQMEWGDRKGTRLDSSHGWTTEIYTLSLHDALPISVLLRSAGGITLHSTE